MAHNEVTACRIHNTVLRRCRCPEKITVITWEDCPGGCWGRDLRVGYRGLTDEDGVIFWREPQLPLDIT